MKSAADEADKVFKERLAHYYSKGKYPLDDATKMAQADILYRFGREMKDIDDDFPLEMVNPMLRVAENIATTGRLAKGAMYTASSIASRSRSPIASAIK